jgi:hypothetical protein
MATQAARTTRSNITVSLTSVSPGAARFGYARRNLSRRGGLDDDVFRSGYASSQPAIETHRLLALSAIRSMIVHTPGR